MTCSLIKPLKRREHSYLLYTNANVSSILACCRHMYVEQIANNNLSWSHLCYEAAHTHTDTHTCALAHPHSYSGIYVDIKQLPAAAADKTSSPVSKSIETNCNAHMRHTKQFKLVVNDISISFSDVKIRQVQLGPMENASISHGAP